jgi:hypothetical protein
MPSSRSSARALGHRAGFDYHDISSTVILSIRTQSKVRPIYHVLSTTSSTHSDVELVSVRQTRWRQLVAQSSATRKTQAAFVSGADDGVALPVSQTGFARDNGRTLGNVDSIRDQAAFGVLAGTPVITQEPY